MESNTWCPRLTAAIILSGSAVQVKVWDQDFSATMAPLICWSFSSSMFKYRLVDHAVPAMWRSLAAARLRAGCASGNAPTTRVRRLTLSAPDMLMRGVAIPNERRQTAVVSRLESDANSGSHAPNSHATKLARIPPRIQMLDLVH